MTTVADFALLKILLKCHNIVSIKVRMRSSLLVADCTTTCTQSEREGIPSLDEWWSNVFLLPIEQWNPYNLHIFQYGLDAIQILTVPTEHTDYKNTCLICKFHSDLLTSQMLNRSTWASNIVRLFRLSLCCLSDSPFTHILRGIRLRISLRNWARQSLVRVLTWGLRVIAHPMYHSL